MSHEADNGEDDEPREDGGAAVDQRNQQSISQTVVFKSELEIMY